MVSEGEIIMQSGQLTRALKRMSMQIIEDLKGKTDVLILGLNERGYHVARVLCEHVSIAIESDIQCAPLNVHSGDDTWVTLLEGHSVVILVDDVLFSGSTMMKAIRLVLDHARISKLRIAVVIDRGHRIYPVQPDFVGLISPTKFLEHVEVAFDANNEPMHVVLTGR